MSQKKFILTISGHDPTCAAGMTMDVMVANKFNIHCLSVISNLTIQDAKKLHKIINVDEKFFKESLKNLTKNFKVFVSETPQIFDFSIIYLNDQLMTEYSF